MYREIVIVLRAIANELSIRDYLNREKEIIVDKKLV